MAMAFPNDSDADKLLPVCPADVTDVLIKKQYTAYRKTLLAAIKDVRQMLWPLGEQNARFVLNGFAATLKAFLKAKQAGPGKVTTVAQKPVAKPAKEEVPPEEVTKVITVVPESETEKKLTAEAGGKPHDGK